MVRQFLLEHYYIKGEAIPITKTSEPLNSTEIIFTPGSNAESVSLSMTISSVKSSHGDTGKLKLATSARCQMCQDQVP